MVLRLTDCASLMPRPLADSAQTQLALAYSLGRLVAGLALPSAPHDTPANLGEDDMLAISEAPAAEKESRRSRAWCLQTEDGALSFRNSDAGRSLGFQSV